MQGTRHKLWSKKFLFWAKKIGEKNTDKKLQILI